MSLDIAYSIEVDDYLDPGRAYDLYWSGAIKDKKKFICPGIDCYARITCANLDEDIQDMKVVPHFRIYGEHSDSCEIFNKIPLKLTYEDGTSVKEEKESIDASVVDVFLLERPKSYYDEPKASKVDSLKTLRKPKFVKSIYDKTLKENGSIGNVYSVRSVVSRFIRYQKDNSLTHRRVNVQGKDVP